MGALLKSHLYGPTEVATEDPEEKKVRWIPEKYEK